MLIQEDDKFKPGLGNIVISCILGFCLFVLFKKRNSECCKDTEKRHLLEASKGYSKLLSGKNLPERNQRASISGGTNRAGTRGSRKTQDAGLKINLLNKANLH